MWWLRLRERSCRSAAALRRRESLTALSLLVGIFQYQPSPFCILDEVDAPSDEANVGRFTELVKEMSVQTQFVLITHSKKTMSIAPVLYGVTMQEPGFRSWFWSNSDGLA